MCLCVMVFACCWVLLVFVLLFLSVWLLNSINKWILWFYASTFCHSRNWTFSKVVHFFFLLLSRLLLVLLLLHFDEMYGHLQLAGNILCVNLTDVQYRKKNGFLSERNGKWLFTTYAHTHPKINILKNPHWAERIINRDYFWCVNTFFYELKIHPVIDLYSLNFILDRLQDCCCFCCCFFFF